MFAEIDKNALCHLPVALATIGDSPRQVPVDRPYGMEYHQFLWVTQGGGVFRVDGENFSLSEGEGFFARAEVPNSYHGEDFSTAWFTFTMSADLLDFLGVGRWFRFTVPAFLAHEKASLERFCCGESTPLSRSVNTYALVSEILGALLPGPVSMEQQVLRYLEIHYAEPLTLDEIASHAGTDRFTLCHTYKSKRGKTVMEELNAIRIAKAKRFLRYTTDTVEHIGKMCGFENASYFSKRFREQCGKTPGVYREDKLKKKPVR